MGGAWPETPTPRFVLNRMFRQKDLCPGASTCPYVLMENPLAGPDSLPCDACPAERLAEYMQTPMGRLLGLVTDLDFALQAGFPVGLRDVSYLEFMLLRQVADERDKYQAEEMRKSSKGGNDGGQ